MRVVLVSVVLAVLGGVAVAQTMPEDTDTDSLFRCKK